MCIRDRAHTAPEGLWKGPRVVQHDLVSCYIPMRSVLGPFGVMKDHLGSWRAIWDHEGPCLVMKGHFWCCFGPFGGPRRPLKRAQGGPTWHIIKSNCPNCPNCKKRQKCPKSAKNGKNAKNLQKLTFWKREKRQIGPYVSPMMFTDTDRCQKCAKTVRLSENEAQKHQKRPKNAKNAIFFQDVSQFF